MGLRFLATVCPTIAWEGWGGVGIFIDRPGALYQNSYTNNEHEKHKDNFERYLTTYGLKEMTKLT